MFQTTLWSSLLVCEYILFFLCKPLKMELSVPALSIQPKKYVIQSIKVECMSQLKVMFCQPAGNLSLLLKAIIKSPFYWRLQMMKSSVLCWVFGKSVTISRWLVQSFKAEWCHPQSKVMCCQLERQVGLQLKESLATHEVQIPQNITPFCKWL